MLNSTLTANTVEIIIVIMTELVWKNTVGVLDSEQDSNAKSSAAGTGESPSPQHLQVLEQWFGHTSFRPLQWEVINSIIRDRRDNCAIMATGYGKSLCYQYPAVYTGNVTIVISPSISLMEDQILSLQKLNIPACFLGSAQTIPLKVIEEEILQGKYKLVYLTPEFYFDDVGKDLLKRMYEKIVINMIAIDEAHCITTWGHDFRVRYRELGKLRDTLPNIPILAVTAAAKHDVQQDIISSLKLLDPQVLRSGFNRENLYLSVHLKRKGKRGMLTDMRTVMTKNKKIWSFTGSTIIYCLTRQESEDIVELLLAQNIKCLPYHAGMTMQERKVVHKKFAADQIQVIVTTGPAFGMGINKLNVRNVVHYGTAKDIESYYLEIGRAGHDGQPSTCTVFYALNDFTMLQRVRGKKNVRNNIRRAAMEESMIKYLETKDCRRQYLLNYFEDSGLPESKKPRLTGFKCCDNCSGN